MPMTRYTFPSPSKRMVQMKLRQVEAARGVYALNGAEMHEVTGFGFRGLPGDRAKRTGHTWCRFRSWYLFVW